MNQVLKQFESESERKMKINVNDSSNERKIRRLGAALQGLLLLPHGVINGRNQR